MPRVKQPAPLQDTVIGAMVDFFSTLCQEWDKEKSLDKLRQAIAGIKENIIPKMPKIFAVEFCNKLLKELTLPSCSFRHLSIVLDIVMDEKLIGLKCTTEILDALVPHEISHIRGFTEVEFTGLERQNIAVSHILRSLRLEDVTTFVYNFDCADSDLIRIGRYCPRLEYVDVSSSNEVTDLGLHGLASCPNLRYLSVARCDMVSRVGLNQFLSVNKTVRELFAWRDDDDAGFDFYNDPKWHDDHSVHPSIESFTIMEDYATDIENCHLQYLVTKFPNLSFVKLAGTFSGDSCILKSLRNLSKIEFISEDGKGWAELELLLKCVGAQINHLRYESGSITPRDVNSIFQLCENLEIFRIHGYVEADPVKLVIPPFKKLKKCSIICCCIDDDAVHKTLEFGKMSKLEHLEIMDFPLSINQIKSIIFDHTNFPNLKNVGLPDWMSDDVKSLRQIARNENLDLEFILLNGLYY